MYNDDEPFLKTYDRVVISVLAVMFVFMFFVMTFDREADPKQVKEAVASYLEEKANKKLKEGFDGNVENLVKENLTPEKVNELMLKILAKKVEEKIKKSTNGKNPIIYRNLIQEDLNKYNIVGENSSTGDHRISYSINADTINHGAHKQACLKAATVEAENYALRYAKNQGADAINITKIEENLTDEDQERGYVTYHIRMNYQLLTRK